MDDQLRYDLHRFQYNLELIAKVLDLSSHHVRAAYGRAPLFQNHPEMKDKFLDVMDALNHLIESCQELNSSSEQ